MTINWDPFLIIIVIIFLIPIIILLRKLIPIFFTKKGHKKLKEENKRILKDSANPKIWFVIGLIFILLNFSINFSKYINTKFWYILGLYFWIIALINLIIKKFYV